MPRKRATQTSNTGVSFAAVRQLAFRLPGVEDGTSYGTPALKVNGKLMARLWEDGATLVLRCTPTVRAHLLSNTPDVYYLTDHYRDYPWVLVRLTAASAELLAPVVEDAWRQVAPKRAVAAFDATRGADPATRNAQDR